MKKITELYDSYLSKDKEERRINERIIDYEIKISRLEKKKSKIGGWHDTLIIPLGHHGNIDFPEIVTVDKIYLPSLA